MHSSRRILLLITAATLLLCPPSIDSVPEPLRCSSANAAQDHPAVSIEHSPYNDATIYRIATDECAITWTVYTTELNRGVIKHSSRCTLPLEQQLPLLTSIYKTVMRQDANAAAFHTLFWGGLLPEQRPSSLEMSFRLAIAAHRSKEWDGTLGKPKHGDMNRFVKDLANSEPIYPELKTVFADVHRTVSIASMEKVRVLEAGRLPFSTELREQGVLDGERLPFDAMVWFTVTTADGASAGKNTGSGSER